MAIGPETLSNEFIAARTVAPHLFLVINSDRPEGGSLAVVLSRLNRVDLRRVPLDPEIDPRLTVDGAGAAILVPDRWMSTVHARLQRVIGSWSIEDAGSRNGTFVNGIRVQRASLRDGDLIEAGHTFFTFRETLPLSAERPRSEGSRATKRGFATVLPQLDGALQQLEDIAQTAIPVLIAGETGTGKDFLASSLHALSGRRGPFQPASCAALAVPDVQSRLFGHVDGGESEGLVRAAAGGTLFFDELADLAPPAQSLLLRTLQDGEAFPVGASRPVRVDVRIVAATNRTPEELAEGNRVRADLLARISGFTIRLPPLRERREDLGILIRSLRTAVPVSFTVEAMRAMLLYRWPLNVRELEKTIEAALVLSGGKPIRVDDLPAPVRAAREEPSTKPAPADRSPAGESSRLQRFVDEASRRHVVRVVVAYAVAVFGALQGFDIIVTRLSLPPQWMVWLVVGSIVGLPVTAVLSWVYDWTRGGIVKTAPLAPGHRASPTVRRVQRRALAFALLLLALLAAGGMLWWRSRARS